jgi:hypothetical protein
MSFKAGAGTARIDYGQGHLQLGATRLPAELVDKIGPELRFLTSLTPPCPLPGAGTWQPLKASGGGPKAKSHNHRNPGHRSPLPGLSAFLDKTSGWAMEVQEALSGRPGAQGPKAGPSRAFDSWKAWPAKPPLGISFLWAGPGEKRLEAIAESLLSAYRPEESLLLIANGQGLLSFAAQKLQSLEIPALCPGPPASPQEIRSSLPALSDQALKERQKSLDEANSDLLAAQKARQSLRDNLASLDKLAALQLDMERLREESSAKARIWDSQTEEIQALHEKWAAAAKRAKTPGLAGIFPGKKALALAEREAREELALAEELSQAHREDRSRMLSEALRLEEEFLAAQEECARLPSREELSSRLEAVSQGISLMAAKAQALSREKDPDPQKEIEKAKLILVRPEHLGLIPESRLFDWVIALSPDGHSYEARETLAGYALKARKGFVAAADFSAWSWESQGRRGPRPKSFGQELDSLREKDGPCDMKEKGESPAWANYLSPELSGIFNPQEGGERPEIPEGQKGLEAIASILSPLPPGLLAGQAEEGDGQGRMGPPFFWPCPQKFPELSAWGLDSPLARLELPPSLSLKGPDQDGPASPASALAAAFLAQSFFGLGSYAKGKSLSDRKEGSGRGGPVYVISPSWAQASIVSGALKDLLAGDGLGPWDQPALSSPPGQKAFCPVWSGGPEDFQGWPPAALVILDPGLLGQSSQRHPWQDRKTGRPAIIRALALAGGALLLLGNQAAMEKLSPIEGPLSELWAASSPLPANFIQDKATPLNFLQTIGQIEPQAPGPAGFLPKAGPLLSERESAEKDPAQRALAGAEDRDSRESPASLFAQTIIRLSQALPSHSPQKPRLGQPSAQGLGPRLSLAQALAQAKTEVLSIFPAISPAWYPALKESLEKAASKASLTILAEVPGPDGGQFPDMAVRDLKRRGAMVVPSTGFSGLLSIIDSRIISLEGARTAWDRDIAHLPALYMPEASEAILETLQYRLLRKKLEGSGYRQCPLCGWPFLLVFSHRPQNFGDRQPLKLGCLNPACPTYRRPRPLDERWPFREMGPVCPVDNSTRYQLRHKGSRASDKNRYWACPKHPDSCPWHRLLPGDAKP